MANDGLLLTGATGFLGMELLLRYLERGDRTVYALVRADDDEQAAERLRVTLARLLGDGYAHAGRVVAVAGDVTADGVGLGAARREQLAAEVTDVVHSAASVSFSLPLEASRRINVIGTANVLELAWLCARRGGLRSFSHISTAYVAGTHRGGFGESDLDLGQDFHNPYERSKFEAEALVRLHAPELPVRVFRPSIIVGDSRTGWTPAFNVLYWPLKAYARGLYSLIPARLDSPVDVVPVDYVADAIVELGARPAPAGQTYQLTAGESAATVGDILELASAYFGRSRPRAVSPGLYRRTIHPALLRSGDARRRRVLEASEVFFPYFSMRVRFGDPAIQVPPLRDYFGRLLDFAVGCDWGKQHAPRAEGALVAA